MEYGGIVMARRPDGALERDILTVLWSARRPLLPAEVKERLGADLAYTSVATVLGRLHAKGLIRRAAAGRAFTYEPAIDEADLAARRIKDVLTSATDRVAVLAGFVGSLSRREVKTLRSLLEDRDR